jgi:hypothetical protein
MKTSVTYVLKSVFTVFANHSERNMTHGSGENCIDNSQYQIMNMGQRSTSFSQSKLTSLYTDDTVTIRQTTIIKLECPSITDNLVGITCKSPDLPDRTTPCFTCMQEISYNCKFRETL